MVGDEMDREEYLITIVEDRTTPSVFGIVLGAEILALEQLQFGARHGCVAITRAQFSFPRSQQLSSSNEKRRQSPAERSYIGG